MQVTWLGHACFLLEEDGYRIVLDPYTGVEGYPELNTEAHAVLCSHGHFDHAAVDRVRRLPERDCPFTVRKVASFHDGAGGSLRGPNTIHVLSAGGVTVVHLGDLGHALSPAQIADIGAADGVLVPVGGVYTVDAAGAKAACDALRPRFAVPMHYRHAPFGLPNVGGVESFLALWPQAEVHRLKGASFTVTPDTAGVLVPSFA